MFIFLGGIGKIWYRKSLGTGIGRIWYRKKVSEPVSEKFGTGKSTGIGIENIWYRKKVSVSVSFNILGTVTHCCTVSAIIVTKIIFCALKYTLSSPSSSSEVLAPLGRDQLG